MEASEIFRALSAGEIDAAEAKRRLLNRVRAGGAEAATGGDEAATGGDEAASGVVVRAEATPSADDIAVVGLNGRFPMASDIDEFWLNLSKGADCVTDIPKGRWDNDEYFSADREAAGKTYCRWGGFISDVEEFDPLFFNISPRDAELIEPQERKFLEVVWETLEQAGYTRRGIERRLKGEVGVFVGAMYQQYHAFDADLPKKAMVALSSYGSMANRVSYFFNLRGPSVALDTMCSSASVAVDLACQSLRAGGCRMAIAGAANLSIHPYKYIALSQTQMLSSDRERRSFSDGDGFIPSEAVGAVLLKRLSDAEADGDRILAVIKSSAVGHKGRSEGFSVPELEAQVSLLEGHFARAGVSPDSISYVEASAAGPRAADAVEFAALRRVFGGAGDGFRCALGSVKANIGHAEAAAGFAQLAKVVLQLFHRKLAPGIKAQPPNPDISFDGTAFHLVEALTDWERPVRRTPRGEEVLPRRACIDTFGAGGTNCHLILEEYAAPEGGGAGLGGAAFPPVFTFSAHRRRTLLPLVEKFRAFFERDQGLGLREIAYTLQLGREAMEHRVAVIAHSRAELLGGLRELERVLSGEARAPHSANLFLGPADPPAATAPPAPELSGDPLDIGESVADQRALAQAWVAGASVEWEDFYGDRPARVVPLPTYPFARRRYWLGRSAPAASGEGAATRVSDEAADAAREAEMARGRAAEFVEGFLSASLALQPGEALSRRASFIELGADSITLSRLAKSVEAEFALPLKNRVFHQHRTIEALADYLAGRMLANGGDRAPQSRGAEEPAAGQATS